MKPIKLHESGRITDHTARALYELIDELLSSLPAVDGVKNFEIDDVDENDGYAVIGGDIEIALNEVLRGRGYNATELEPTLYDVQFEMTMEDGQLYFAIVHYLPRNERNVYGPTPFTDNQVVREGVQYLVNDYLFDYDVFGFYNDRRF